MDFHKKLFHRHRWVRVGIAKCFVRRYFNDSDFLSDRDDLIYKARLAGRAEPCNLVASWVEDQEVFTPLFSGT